jgi:hypothetical protein
VRPQGRALAQAQAFLADRLTFDGPVIHDERDGVALHHGADGRQPALSFGVLSFYHAGFGARHVARQQGRRARGGYAGSTPSLAGARY